MKNSQFFAALALFLFVAGSSVAQDKESERQVAFGGATFFNTSLAGNWAIEGGGLGARFINSGLYIGGGGFGLSQEKNGYAHDMGYGGLMLGYMWGSWEKTSMHFYTLGGYGGIEENGKDTGKKSDGFWAVKPTVEVDFLVARWLRIGVGGGYRWIVGADLPSADDGGLSAPFGGVTFRFGNWQ